MQNIYYWLLKWEINPETFCEDIFNVDCPYYKTYMNSLYGVKSKKSVSDSGRG